MQGNLHVPFLGGLAGAIPPGYPALGRRTVRQRALILPTGIPTLTYLAYDASQSIPKPNSCLGSKVHHMDPSVMWPEAQTHLFTLCRYWGAALRREA